MTTSLSKQAAPFLDHLERWYEALPEQKLEDIIGSKPERVAIVCVDMIKGFATEGPLASPRVQGIAQPIAGLFHRAFDLGVRHFVLFEDSHTPNAVEFGSYPPHAIAGTSEAETIPELAGLGFAVDFHIIKKNALSGFFTKEMEQWAKAHPEVEVVIMVGNCTDLCIYQNAMYLRLKANAGDIRTHHVIVPAQLVDTYDMPLETAQQLGSYAHPGDLHHLFFLHHMGQNGVQIVRSIS